MFIENLEKRMKQKYINKKELAEKLGISASAVTTWKTRKSYPTVDKLKKICEILEISADELLGLSPPEKKIEKLPDMNTDERLLLKFYKNCSDKEKEKILEIAMEKGVQEKSKSKESSSLQTGEEKEKINTLKSS